MKNYFNSVLLAASLMIVGNVKAQDYSIDPSNSVSFDVPFDFFTEQQIKLHNETTDSLDLTWEVISNKMVSGWDFSLCDYGTCYITLPNGTVKQMKTIPPGAYGFFKLTVNPTSVDGSGIFKLIVYSAANASSPDTITFTANTPTGVAESSPKAELSVYPNPAKDFINIKWSDNYTGSPQSVVVFNIIGEKVAEALIKAGFPTQLNTMDFSSGVYFIKFFDENNLAVTKKFYVFK